MTDKPDRQNGDGLRICAECDWPEDQAFTFRDEPGEHDPCYVVMPGGAMLSVNHHAGHGVDIARAKFIVQACNAALSVSTSNVDPCPVCGINNNSPFPCEHAAQSPTRDGAEGAAKESTSAAVRAQATPRSPASAAMGHCAEVDTAAPPKPAPPDHTDLMAAPESVDNDLGFNDGWNGAVEECAKLVKDTSLRNPDNIVRGIRALSSSEPKR